jgi:hypothetical protein
VLFIVQCEICPKQKWKAIFEEFIENCLHKAESVLKILLYLLDLGTCVALMFHLRINFGQFPVCALYCNNTQNKASICRSIHQERVMNVISYNKCTQ